MSHPLLTAAPRNFPMKVTFSLLPVLATTVLSFGLSLPAFARPATLTAQTPDSQINVRSAPTTTAASPHYGVVGDRVEVLRETIQDGDRWNYVKFSSGAEGWIRADFIRYRDRDADYAVLQGEPGDRINVRSAPSTGAASPSYGLEGDVVKVLNQTTSKDGYVWIYVQFPSGAKGWVRGDLVRFAEVGC